VAAPTDESVDLASRFTLAVLPDTQFYSRYAASQFERPDRYGPGNNPFASQTAWLAEHAEELRIPFVAHLGDVVDQGLFVMKRGSGAGRGSLETA